MFEVFLLFLLSLILQDQDGASERSIQLLLHCQTDEMIAVQIRNDGCGTAAHL